MPLLDALGVRRSRSPQRHRSNPAAPAGIPAALRWESVFADALNIDLAVRDALIERFSGLRLSSYVGYSRSIPLGAGHPDRVPRSGSDGRIPIGLFGSGFGVG
eukprot:8330918-Alexandrium_andersonii.AAC.1